MLCRYNKWYYFQVVFEVAFNSAKGGYVALDDISFSPVYCSNQTGKSSFCCLISLFSSLLCFLERQYFQCLVVLCSCCFLIWPIPVGLPLLTRQNCKADKENTILLMNYLETHPYYFPSGNITSGFCNWCVGLNAGGCPGFSPAVSVKEVKVLDFSLLLMRGISLSIHMPWGVLQSQSRSYVFLSMLFQKVLFPTRSGTSVRILLDFHSGRSQLSPHDLCSLGIWGQGLWHVWGQLLNSVLVFHCYC